MLVGIRWISQCRHRPHQQNDRVLTGLKKIRNVIKPKFKWPYLQEGHRTEFHCTCMFLFCFFRRTEFLIIEKSNVGQLRVVTLLTQEHSCRPLQFLL